MLLLLAENGSRIHRYSGARTVENLAEFARVRATVGVGVGLG